MLRPPNLRPSTHAPPRASAARETRQWPCTHPATCLCPVAGDFGCPLRCDGAFHRRLAAHHLDVTSCCSCRPCGPELTSPLRVSYPHHTEATPSPPGGVPVRRRQRIRLLRLLCWCFFPRLCGSLPRLSSLLRLSILRFFARALCASFDRTTRARYLTRPRSCPCTAAGESWSPFTPRWCSHQPSQLTTLTQRCATPAGPVVPCVRALPTTVVRTTTYINPIRTLACPCTTVCDLGRSCAALVLLTVAFLACHLCAELLHHTALWSLTHAP